LRERLSATPAFIARYEAELRNVQPDDVFVGEVKMVIAAIEEDRREDSAPVA